MNRTVMGSSPRVRGSPISNTRPAYNLGIIPAGAGLTDDHFIDTPKNRDHPRGCGAHCPSKRSTHPALGSSPRVRGSHTSIRVAGRYRGIIPAGAGLTARSITATTSSRDHPRGCGAHFKADKGYYRKMGSSPRVRGSQLAQRKAQMRDGIIPAGAGLTAAALKDRWRIWDHPRGCGAHTFCNFFSRPLMGSSPRVRGSLLTLSTVI